MSIFSRRQVLGSLSAGALGLLALGKGKSSAAGPGHLPAPDLSALAGRRDKTRLYYIFSAKAKGLEGWPFHEYDHVKRARFFEKRIKRIKDIEWVGGEIIEKDEKKFVLDIRGEKLKGKYVLLHFKKGGEKNWLFFKKKD